MNPQKTPADPCGELVAANQQAHTRVLGLWEECLVALTELAHDRASHAWRALTEAVAAHQLIEEAAYAHWPSAPAPRGGTKELLLAEHTRLGTLIDEGARCLARLADARAGSEQARRLALIRELDPFLRVRHLLQHHGGREDEIVYPWLARHLPTELVCALATELAAPLQSSPQVSV